MVKVEERIPQSADRIKISVTWTVLRYSSCITKKFIRGNGSERHQKQQDICICRWWSWKMFYVSEFDMEMILNVHLPRQRRSRWTADVFLECLGRYKIKYFNELTQSFCQCHTINKYVKRRLSAILLVHSMILYDREYVKLKIARFASGMRLYVRVMIEAHDEWSEKPEHRMSRPETPTFEFHVQCIKKCSFLHSKQCVKSHFARTIAKITLRWYWRAWQTLTESIPDRT